MGFDADLTYLDERNQVRGRDPNLFYDPVTGYNRDPASYGRPNPIYGELQWMESTGKTETMLLSTSFTRRFKDNFQGGVTYTRTLKRNDNTTGFGIQANNQFDLDGDWSRSDRLPARHLPGEWDRQPAVAGHRRRARIFYGSGTYYNATLSGRPYSKPGTNRLNLGAPIIIPAAVLDRWDGPDVIATGAVWPRNALRGLPLHKVDMRVSKTHHARRRREGRRCSAKCSTCSTASNFGSYNGPARLGHVRATRRHLGQRLRAALGPARVPFSSSSEGGDSDPQRPSVWRNSSAVETADGGPPRGRRGACRGAVIRVPHRL